MKMCKAINRAGLKCGNQAMCDGYCIAHFNIQCRKRDNNEMENN